MTWVKIDDQYPDHPKVMEVGPLGMALHLAATCYASRYLTDGFVPAGQMAKLINFDGIGVSNAVSHSVSNAVSHNEVTAALVEAGLLEVAPGGFQVHDYLLYNPPAGQVRAERARNAARQAGWRASHPQKAAHNTVTNTVTNAGSIGAPYPIKDQQDEDGEDDESSSWASVDDPVNAAIQRAYDAGKIQLTGSHLQAHRDMIAKHGIPAWEDGFAAAAEAGKHNIINYVMRCVESASIARSNGSKPLRKRGGRRPDAQQDVPSQGSTAAERFAHYVPKGYEDAIER